MADSVDKLKVAVIHATLLQGKMTKRRILRLKSNNEGDIDRVISIPMKRIDPAIHPRNDMTSNA